MKQSKWHSVMEAISNTGFGFILSYVSVLLIYPIFELRLNYGGAFLITLYFTLLSFIRVYILRRIFTHLTESRR